MHTYYISYLTIHYTLVHTVTSYQALNVFFYVIAVGINKHRNSIHFLQVKIEYRGILGNICL